MRSKIAQQILNETPEDVHIFVRKYADIIVRVHKLLREKGWIQKELAAKMEMKPLEISKWLSGDHNFTLRCLAKLEAELGAEIICVPGKLISFRRQITHSISSRSSAPFRLCSKITPT